MHLNAILRQSAVFLQGSPAVFLQFLQNCGRPLSRFFAKNANSRHRKKSSLHDFPRVARGKFSF